MLLPPSVCKDEIFALIIIEFLKKTIKQSEFVKLLNLKTIRMYFPHTQKIRLSVKTGHISSG